MMNKKRVEKELKKRYSKAEKIIKNPTKLDDFLERLERKIKKVPKVGEKLSNIVVLASLVKHYATKEYADFPMASLIAIVAVLLYFVSPIDVCPDMIPIIGYIDDTLVLMFCWSFLETDIDKYLEWREKRY